ncbi:MAG: RHS repeat-associated core domain-containing protein [Bacteroidetes bacterium]|nr:RHS repeat-associated core domain-containing protein [Bacteroidota bacterium]
MGNVLATILDRRTIHDVDTGYVGGDSVFIALWDADIINAQDYYPFGMLLPNRIYQADSSGTGDYRYAFNGMERDDEVSGNAYDFGARIYDPRIGRFLSIDPLMESFPIWSPYVYAGNSPISYIDVYGMGPDDAGKGDEVVENEGPLAYALRNNVEGKTSLEVLENLATMNGDVFKNYNKDWTDSEKWSYWNDLSGENWMIHPGQKLHVGGVQPTDIKELQKFKADFQYGNDFDKMIDVLTIIDEDFTNRAAEDAPPTQVKVKDIFDVNKMLSNGSFVREGGGSIGSVDGHYKSTNKDEPTIRIAHMNVNLSLELMGEQASNVRWKVTSWNDDGTANISYSLTDDKTPRGMIRVYIEGYHYENFKRNTGVVINFDMSNPHHYKRFKELQSETGPIYMRYTRPIMTPDDYK